MSRQNLRLSWRIIIKNKTYSLINIIGLSLSMCLAMFIALWIHHEKSYDDFHENSELLYQAFRHARFGDDVFTSNSIPYPLFEELRQDPDIEDLSLLSYRSQFRVVQKDELKTSERGYFADAAFFNLFSWNIIQGQQSTLLKEPNTIVISRALAEKCFGSNWETQNNPIGQTLRLNDDSNYSVSGVFENPPINSTLQFDFLLPVEEFITSNPGNYQWDNSNFRLYIKTRPETDPQVVNARIKNLQNEHIEGFTSEVFLHPYTDLHLRSTFKDGFLITGRIEYYIRIFSLVALFVIIIASVNFVNISIARSLRRAREIGVRKVIGANRRLLLSQFAWESLLLVFMSFVLGTILLVIGLPAFNTLTEKQVDITQVGDNVFLILLGIGLLTALIASIYPAVYLASIRLIRALQGTFKLSNRTIFMRKGLVVFQFVLSIALIIATLTVHNQLQYIQSKNLGLDRENVIYIRMDRAFRRQFLSFKEELKKNPAIKQVSSSNSNPLAVTSSTHTVSWPGYENRGEKEVYILNTDYDFLEVMDIKLEDGRDFDSSYGADKNNYIINQKMKDLMAMDDPVGQPLNIANSPGEVVGVVDNFHMTSLYSEIQPMVIRLNEGHAPWMFMRTEPGTVKEAVKHLQEVYSSFNPILPLEYDFLDESYRETYQSEVVVGRLMLLFTIFGIFVACLGLLGLAVSVGKQREKEVSIRKVFGANVYNLIFLLSKEFLVLVIIAFVVSIPLAYLGMKEWLSHFAYRTTLSPTSFFLAGLSTLLITFFIVGSQGLKAAIMNPIKALRSD
ncbi:MAG: ABC transporter permease [Bacteroidota bacterium]